MYLEVGLIQVVMGMRMALGNALCVTKTGYRFSPLRDLPSGIFRTSIEKVFAENRK